MQPTENGYQANLPQVSTSLHFTEQINIRETDGTNRNRYQENLPQVTSLN